MQQIERYGVIALVFMLVTVVAVSFWDGGDVEPGREDAAQEARVAAAAPTDPVELSRPRRVDPRERDGGSLPLSRPGAPAARRERADGRSVSGRRVDDGRPDLTPGAATLRGDDVPRTVRSEPAGSTAVAEATASAPVRLVPAHREEPKVEARRASVPAPRPVELETPRGGRITASAPPARTGPEIVSSVGAVHEVRPGDTLERIASSALGDRSRWREIQQLNGDIDPRRLLVGMKLRLPTGARGVAARVPAPAARPVAAPAERPGRAGRTYRVQPGDMLSRIAQRELGSAQRWREIVALNPGVDPDRLFIGAELVLPGAPVPALVADARSETRSSADARSDADRDLRALDRSKGLRVASSSAADGRYRVR